MDQTLPDQLYHDAELVDFYDLENTGGHVILG